MKSHRLLGVLIAAIGIVFSCTVNAASVYHLVCRGGSAGNTRLRIASFSDSGVLSTNVFYMFERYSGPASSIKSDGSHLLAGQCSWSTGLLARNQNYFLHEIQNSSVMTTVDFTPLDDNGMQTEIFSQSFIFPDRNDPNQNYLPSYTPRAATSSVNGSIFDSNMVFHIYVKILTDNSLQFSYLKSAMPLT
jgi:hypothetical protein